MSKIRVLVVEDESIVSKDIQNSLKRLGYAIAGASATGEKAVQLAASEKPDLILMDIMLKGEMNGIEAAEIINQQQGLPVIFLTAYADEETISKAKISEPFGYIIKPFKEIDLHTSIEMALYKHKKEKEVEKERDILYSIVENKDTQDFFFVKSNSRLVKLKINEIFLVEALKDYVVIHTKDTKFTIHSTMKDIEKKLSDKIFMRIHRSYIINLDQIDSIEGSNIQLENGLKKIPIGGSYKDKLLQRLNFL